MLAVKGWLGKETLGKEELNNRVKAKNEIGNASYFRRNQSKEIV